MDRRAVRAMLKHEIHLFPSLLVEASVDAFALCSGERLFLQASERASERAGERGQLLKACGSPPTPYTRQVWLANLRLVTIEFFQC